MRIVGIMTRQKDMNVAYFQKAQNQMDTVGGRRRKELKDNFVKGAYCDGQGEDCKCFCALQGK